MGQGPSRLVPRMIPSEAIANLQARLQSAVSANAVYQRAGGSETYMESCSLVLALETQLARLRLEQAANPDSDQDDALVTPPQAGH
jgi:hypothetical protein